MRKLFVLAISSVAMLQAASARADEANAKNENGPPAQASAPAAPQENSPAVKALEDRVTELEAHNILNRFTLGGYFAFRYDDITYRPNNDRSKDNHVTPFSLHLALNVDAQLSDDLKFYSTFGMYKLGSVIAGSNAVSVNNALAADVLGDYTRTSSAVYVERAYFDYHLRFLPLVISAGRLPTINGPPSNLWDGEPRSGTYPIMCYDAILDGVALTVTLGKYLPAGQNLNLRGVYTPVGQFDFALPYRQVASGGTSYPSITPSGSLMLEYGIKPKHLVDSADLILEYGISKNLKVSPSLLAPNSPVPLAGDFATNTQVLTAYLELGNLADLGLTLAVSYTESIYASTGSMVVAGTPMPVAVGTGTTRGRVALFSLRYQIPFSAIGRPYLGGEYLYSTKGFSANGTLVEEDLTGFYNSRGRAFHLYYTQPITDGLSLRVGYRRQNLIAAGTLDSLVDSSDRFMTYYANVRLDL